MSDDKHKTTPEERPAEQLDGGPEAEPDGPEKAEAATDPQPRNDTGYAHLPEALLRAIPESRRSPAVHEALSELDEQLSGERETEPEDGQADSGEDSAGEVPPPLRRVDEPAGGHSCAELIRMGYGRG